MTKSQSIPVAYDIVIIGGGVVGSLIAYKLSKYNIRIALLEMREDLACGASGANSGIVHAGHDPMPSSLKAKYNIAGRKVMPGLCRDLGVPYKNNGSIVLSFSEEESSTLESLVERGKENQVEGMKILSRDETIRKEPNISREIHRSLYIPSGSIVCPFELTIAAGETAFLNGTDFYFEHEVVDITLPRENKTGKYVLVCKNSRKDNTRNIEAGLIINAAGVNSGEICEMAGDYSHRIKPRRGEYIVLDRALSGYVEHTIFSAPTEKGKGVLVTPTVDGNILVGPNSHNVNNPYDVKTTKEGMDEISKFAVKYFPGLDMGKAIRTFSGIRATPDGGDFIVKPSDTVENFIIAGGIESPGLTAAPAIADQIEKIVFETSKANQKEEYISKREARIRFSDLTQAQQQSLIEKNPDYANVVCRCEHVTLAEVKDSMGRPLGAMSLNAIKVRTRAGMGRCQGGFCLPHLIPAMTRELDISPCEIKLAGKGTEILKGEKR